VLPFSAVFRAYLFCALLHRYLSAGPAPVDLLEALWLAGEMDGLTPVWKEGMPDYLPVSQVFVLVFLFWCVCVCVRLSVRVSMCICASLCLRGYVSLRVFITVSVSVCVRSDMCA